MRLQNEASVKYRFLDVPVRNSETYAASRRHYCDPALAASLAHDGIQVNSMVGWIETVAWENLRQIVVQHWSGQWASRILLQLFVPDPPR